MTHVNPDGLRLHVWGDEEREHMTTFMDRLTPLEHLRNQVGYIEHHLNRQRRNLNAEMENLNQRIAELDRDIQEAQIDRDAFTLAYIKMGGTPGEFELIDNHGMGGFKFKIEDTAATQKCDVAKSDDASSFFARSEHDKNG